ncbi:STAS domain-containing protein [Peribacillus glennii]|uniref:STAS domain-containing protein n=1 Tax=Peribacillus glennii TaxID=2303991 RepID=A0A372LFB2_9BACI|nr:STAS domain-containing protein [Peribacillus glennii]RFU64694.1 STAS domain-containing protein [Peribacillus glennii]
MAFVKDKVTVKVNSNEFVWDPKNGLFTFDGAPALLFWDSAIELFLKTIEEVSGEVVSKTVYEATGYRMGHLVSSYYSGRRDLEQLLEEYSDIYRNAGWGNVKIAYYNFEEKRAVVQLTNSWEHRIFNNTDKETAGVLLPSHWAGVFTGLFEQKVWYKINKSQLDGNEYDEIEIFPSDVTPSRNIFELARQKETEHILELEQKVKERTEELSTLVKELSSPIIPVLKGILVVPLIGNFNEERVANFIERSLLGFSRQQGSYLLIDLTGVKGLDSYTMDGIQKLILSIRLVGGECFVVGISAEQAIMMSKTNIQLNNVHTFATLQQGVEFAIEQIGFEIKRKKAK